MLRQPPPSSWRREIAYRVRYLFLLKVAGTTLWTTLFFVGYFHLLRHPASAATVMPLTALDRGIPFMPFLLGAYVSLWVYVGLAPGLQRTLKELLVYGLWAGALCAAGLLCFYLWPTQTPPHAIDTAGYPGFDVLQGVDAAGNACPSMHVAIAMFTVLHLEDVLRRVQVPALLRVVNLLWFAAICLSTLAIKQHVVLDVLAGAVLGLVFAMASLRWRPSAQRPGRAAIIPRSSETPSGV